MANKFFPATALTGGTDSSLDGISVSDLTDGDKAIVITNSEIYYYTYNMTSGSAESSPDIIVPDDATGDEAWELIKYYEDNARIQALIYG